jgi:hypothetical protein
VFACGHGHDSATLYRSTGAHPANDVVPSPGLLLVDLHLLKQPFRALPGEADPGGPFDQKRPLEPGLSCLLTRDATPEDLEAIRLTCLEKEIELEPILGKWQVSRLEELDGASAQQVQEWLKGQ